MGHGPVWDFAANHQGPLREMVCQGLILLFCISTVVVLDQQFVIAYSDSTKHDVTSHEEKSYI